MIPVIVFLLSIGVQLAAAILALLLIRYTGRKSAWILISLAMVFMTVRRLISFAKLLTAGKELTLEISELIALVISCLILLGVLRIGVYFRSMKSVESMLRESEKRYRSLFENMLDGFAYCRMLFEHNRPQDFIYLDVNSAFEKLTGLKNVVGRKVTEVIPGIRESYPGLFEIYGRVAMTGQPEKFEIYLEPLGAWLSISVYSTKKEYFIAVFDNITERKKAEEGLMKSEKRYRHLIESVTDYIYTVKLEDGKPVETIHGPGCMAVTGYTAEEYQAEPSLWLRMIYEEDRDMALKNVNRVLSGEAVPYFEHRIIHKDGSIRWVKDTLVLRYDEHGRLVGYDGLISDITEFKKLEAQLRQSQKMEAIGQFAGGIAHDFNNILTAIMGYANLLQMKIKEDDQARHNVDQILTSADRAARLTQSLLAFSRKRIISPQPVNLNEIITRVEKLLFRVIGEDVELKTILSEKDLIIRADSGQIEQVLMNLANNARDAMPSGGSLTIETGLVKLDTEYIKTHGYGEIGECALISVTDTGEGMDEETREKIFEPFFTTKEFGKGTGLGLSIVYGIIKQHDGYINCYSEPHKGTTFKIYLPVTAAVVEEKKVTEIILSTGGDETILLAEDDEDVKSLTKTVLEEFGYKVIEAADGEEAIRRFIDNKDKIQLLIFDVVMPRIGGKKAYEKIRKMKPDIKVIFTSGYTADFVQKRDIIEKGWGFITKPVSPTELLKKVREVLDKQGKLLFSQDNS